MDPLIIGAGIAAIGSIIGNLIQGHSSKKNTQAQIEYDQSALNQQNAFNVEMWNKTNEYNSPVNERARLEEAGINPLNVSGSLGPASALQSAGALGYQQPMAINPFEGAFDSVLTAAQVENVQADTAKKNQESLTEVQRRENMKVQLDRDRQEIENMKLDKNLTEKEIHQIDKALSWIDKLNQANVEYQDSMSALNRSQQRRIDELLEGEKLLQSKNIDDFEYRWNALMAAARKDNALASLTDKDIEFYALNHAQNGILGSGLSIPNLIRAGIGKQPDKKLSEMDVTEQAQYYGQR